ncbi:hypothetical protein DdX_14903 [Ditylenchus destructor]|uniref:Uncharacterized protein n=1 Tax=Ditylenchus destructor TaxID=166010 RepID=A0AAD4QY79_9BILA|nr:hypothetical protein DdX_14903 [Ditylenchus destructor]
MAQIRAKELGYRSVYCMPDIDSRTARGRQSQDSAQVGFESQQKHLPLSALELIECRRRLELARRGLLYCIPEAWKEKPYAYWDYMAVCTLAFPLPAYPNWLIGVPEPRLLGRNKKVSCVYLAG